MTATNWAFRTVRNGQVTIGGVKYRPREDNVRYDGRLDGIVMAFARYEGEPFVSLWGSKARFDCLDDFDPAATRPEVVDGYLPWLWWDGVPPPALPTTTCDQCGVVFEHQPGTIPLCCDLCEDYNDFQATENSGAGNSDTSEHHDVS